MQVQLLQEPLYSSVSRGVKSCRLDRSTDVREVKRLGKGILKAMQHLFRFITTSGLTLSEPRSPLGDKSLEILVKNAPPKRECGSKNMCDTPL